MKYIIIPLLLLSACAGTPEPEIRTVEVQVPVVRPCDARTQIGPRQTHVDSDEALRAIRDDPNISWEQKLYNAVRLLLAGRETRIAREDVLERSVDACSN